MAEDKNQSVHISRQATEYSICFLFRPSSFGLWPACRLQSKSGIRLLELERQIPPAFQRGRRWE
jgi:hypothetical protein